MRVLLFADGSRQIGSGHQIRMAALADALASRGAEPVLACRDLPGSAHPWSWQGKRVEVLASEMTPIDACRMARDRIQADLVMVDHYGIDGGMLAGVGVPVALVDDVPGSRSVTGVQLVANGAPGTVPAHYPDIHTVCGARACIMRPEFARGAATGRSGGPVLVMAGGSDAAGLGAQMAAAVMAGGRQVVTAGLTRHPGACNIGIVDAAKLAAQMVGCSAAFVSCSSIALEALAIGLPVVTIRTAENQRHLAAGLGEAGVPVLEPGSLTEVGSVLDDLAPVAISGLGRGGSEVVAERLLELPAWRLDGYLRPTVWQDMGRLLEWANDPVTRAASFRSGMISEAEHAAWLARALCNPDLRLMIAQDDGVPVGSLRLERCDGRATISISVSGGFRRRGHGGRMLEAAARWCRRTAFVKRIDAFIRHDNPASIALFRNAGYAGGEAAVINGHPAWRYGLGIE